MLTTDIFVVDDERVIGQTLGIILRQAGYRVEVFHDPHTALRGMARVPRLLLTDQDMPGLTGCSLAALFALTQPTIEIVLLSGQLSGTDLEWQMLQRRKPTSCLLRKPLHPTHLLDEVRARIGTPAANWELQPAELHHQPNFSSSLPERVMQNCMNAAMMAM